MMMMSTTQCGVAQLRRGAAPRPLSIKAQPLLLLARPTLLPLRRSVVVLPPPASSAAGADAAAPEPEKPAAAAAAPTPVAPVLLGGAGAGAPAAAKPASKPRLPCLDALRFFLIAYIAVGHFVTFATRDVLTVKFFSQVNVWVGAFFVLSGYVAGYTATELGKLEAGPRVKPAAAYTVGRVAGYYPLFLLTTLAFGPMFFWADATYNGAAAAAWHGFLSLGLLQAWFPAHAEVWNAPTWFLSALTFSMAALPHALPWVASLNRKGLWKLLLALTAASLVPKIAYSYDLNVWSLLEGVTPPKAHPNLLFWNVTRFNPLYALFEVLLGAAAARLVMVDGLGDDGKPVAAGASDGAVTKLRSAVLPALGLVAVTFARAAGWLPLNDPLTRCLLFVPLFTLLVVNLHRNAVAPGGPQGLTALLSTKPLAYLGAISFPIFILHGPIGQVFYKKIVATKLWGHVMGQGFFPAYCAVVLAAAVAVQHLVLENKKVGEISAAVTKRITAAL